MCVCTCVNVCVSVSDCRYLISAYQACYQSHRELLGNTTQHCLSILNLIYFGGYIFCKHHPSVCRSLLRVWRPAAVFISCHQALSIFLLRLRGQRSAQCQGRVTSCHFDECGPGAALICPCQLTLAQSQWKLFLTTLLSVQLRQKQHWFMFYIILTKAV